MASQLAANQVQGTKRRNDGKITILCEAYFRMKTLCEKCRSKHFSLSVVCMCIDNGKPVPNFTGMQEQPHRNVIERFGGRRGTELKTI